MRIINYFSREFGSTLYLILDPLELILMSVFHNGRCNFFPKDSISVFRVI